MKGNVVWRFLFSEVSQVTSQVDLLTSKEATSQNKAFCTSPQWNICLFLISLFYLLVFFPHSPHFLWCGIKFEHDPSVSFKKYWEQSVSTWKSWHTVKRYLNISEYAQIALSHVLHVKHLGLSDNLSKYRGRSLHCWTSPSGQTGPVTVSKPAKHQKKI